MKQPIVLALNLEIGHCITQNILYIYTAYLHKNTLSYRASLQIDWIALLVFLLDNVLPTHQNHAAQAWIEGVLVCVK